MKAHPDLFLFLPILHFCNFADLFLHFSLGCDDATHTISLKPAVLVHIRFIVPRNVLGHSRGK